MQYVIAKDKQGRWQASMRLPTGDGSLESVARGLTKAEATVAAARASAAGAAATPNATARKQARKAAIVGKLAAVAANPVLAKALRSGGLALAETVASTLPGGAMAVKVLKYAAKFGPAKRLLGKLLG